MACDPETPLHLLDGPVLLRRGGVVRAAARPRSGLGGPPCRSAARGAMCFTGALLAISAIALFYQLGGANGRGRSAALIGVVQSGVIVAGAIMVRRGEAHGRTTVAHILFASMVGVACGAAQGPLVGSVSIVAIVMLTLAELIERCWPMERARWVAPG